MLQLIFVVAALASAQRLALLALHRNWFRQGLAGDGAYHFNIVRQLQRSRTYTGVDEFLLAGAPDTYPVLFQKLVSFLPLRVTERYPYLPNLVLWIALTAAAAVFAQYVGGTLLDPPEARFGAIFALVFLTLASNLSLDMNGLNYIALSERLMARFACAFYFAGLTVGMMFGDLTCFAVAVVAGAIAGTSSVFGRQAVAFVTPLVALIALDFRPLLVFALAFAGACAIDRDFFLRGLYQMVTYLQAYNRHTKHSRYYRLGHSKFVEWRQVLRGPLAQRLNHLESREPTRILFRFPELIVLALLWPELHLPATPIAAVVIGSLIVYVATSTMALRHLGEAHRYLEYNLWIVVPLVLADILRRDSVPAELILAYGAWLAFATGHRTLQWRRASYPDRDKLREFLVPLGLDARACVFPVPMPFGGAVSARTACRALVYQGANWTSALHQKYAEELPFLKRDWRTLAAEFGVTHVIAEKSYLDAMQQIVGWRYDFTGLETLAENDAYIAYAVTSAQSAERAA